MHLSGGRYLIIIKDRFLSECDAFIRYTFYFWTWGEVNFVQNQNFCIQLWIIIIKCICFKNPWLNIFIICNLHTACFVSSRFWCANRELIFFKIQMNSVKTLNNKRVLCSILYYSTCVPRFLLLVNKIGKYSHWCIDKGTL